MWKYMPKYIYLYKYEEIYKYSKKSEKYVFVETYLRNTVTIDVCANRDNYTLTCHSEFDPVEKYQDEELCNNS